MKPIVRLFFTDFWDVFDMENNVFANTLRKDFEVVISDQNPDMIIYSWEGKDFLKFDCIRVYYTPENWLMPKYHECDFSLSFEHWDDPRNLRFPNYMLYEIYPEHLNKPHLDLNQIIESKKDFCSMVVSNPNTPLRQDFFRKLSKYKKVNSGGKVENNIGGRVKDKYAFVRDHKFNICFENAMHPGYTSEKIVQDMKCMTIPIYWGDPLIHFEFNSKSFFNYADYNSEDDLIDDVICHDQDDTLYVKKFIEPWFEDNIPNQYFDLQRLRFFLKKIVDNKENYTPIAQNFWKGKIAYPLKLKSLRTVNKVRRLVRL